MKQVSNKEYRNYTPFNLVIGDVFGRLSYTGRTSFKEDGKGHRKRIIEAKCECGVVRDYVWDTVSRGHTKSCGCLQSDLMKLQKHQKTHGLSGHPLFNTWRGMRERCYYPKHNRFKYYGAKGKTVYPLWKDDFKAFYDWAIENGYEEGLTLDRFPDRDGNYEPTNCRFVGGRPQKLNTDATRLITAFGETKSMLEWSEDVRCKVSYSGLRNRVGRDKEFWEDIELAIITPAQNRGMNKDNRVEVKNITAFGETKSIKDWLSDERCVINEERLRFRVFRKSWDVEKALTTPERKLPNK